MGFLQTFVKVGLELSGEEQEKVKDRPEIIAVVILIHYLFFETVSCMLGYLIVIAKLCAHLQSHFGTTLSEDTWCARN